MDLFKYYFLGAVSQESNGMNIFKALETHCQITSQIVCYQFEFLISNIQEYMLLAINLNLIRK